MPLSLSASMTRWKPSVSSCSAPDASVFCAVFSMGLISLVVSSRTSSSSSVEIASAGQFLTVRLDKGGEAQRVVARTLLGKVGIACLQRLDDSKVLRQ